MANWCLTLEKIKASNCTVYMDGMICRLCVGILYNMLFTPWPCPSLHSTHGSHRLDISVYSKISPIQLKFLSTHNSKLYLSNMSQTSGRSKSENLLSLDYFQPEFLSVASPNPIVTTAGPNRYSMTMASVQGIMLSGRFWAEALVSYWSENGSKHCKHRNIL